MQNEIRWLKKSKRKLSCSYFLQNQERDLQEFQTKIAYQILKRTIILDIENNRRDSYYFIEENHEFILNPLLNLLYVYDNDAQNSLKNNLTEKFSLNPNTDERKRLTQFLINEIFHWFHASFGMTLNRYIPLQKASIIFNSISEMSNVSNST